METGPAHNGGTQIDEIINHLLDQGYNNDSDRLKNTLREHSSDRAVIVKPGDFKIDFIYKTCSDLESQEQLLIFAVSSQRYNIKSILFGKSGQPELKSISDFKAPICNTMKRLWATIKKYRI